LLVGCLVVWLVGWLVRWFVGWLDDVGECCVKMVNKGVVGRRGGCAEDG